jgi:hypothetical protein
MAEKGHFHELMTDHGIFKEEKKEDEKDKKGEDEKTDINVRSLKLLLDFSGNFCELL